MGEITTPATVEEIRPTFGKCCFCLPLRPGLLLWGYIKLVIFFYVLFKFSFEVLFLCFENLTVLAFTILLIVACHKKSVKLLRISYICECVLAIVSLVSSVLLVMVLFFEGTPGRTLINMALVALVWIAIQVYFVALIKSAIVQLAQKPRDTEDGASQAEDEPLPTTKYVAIGVGSNLAVLLLYLFLDNKLF